MTPENKKAAIDHAIAEYPHESCGLLVIINGVETYVPCKNKAITKSEHFVLSAEDYANAEEQGVVVAVVHSHPDASCRPSEADRVSCEGTGMIWYIFSVSKEGNEIVSTQDIAIEPTGYEAPLIGRTFSFGILDCYTLIRDWYRRELGVELEDAPRSDLWWERGENLYMKNYQDYGWEKVKDGTLQVGDVILMQIRSADPNHAAVYIGDGFILHHLYGRLSSKDIYGGYWVEKTALIVRRKKNDDS